MFSSRFGNIFLTHQTFVTNLHLLKVELRCRLQEKLHRVTEPMVMHLEFGQCEYKFTTKITDLPTLTVWLRDTQFECSSHGLTV